MSSSRPENTDSPQKVVNEAAEAGKKRRTFFSFGNEGVTATVGANGRLLRISRHFPGKNTGFCVDDPMMPEPWLAQKRFKTLQNWAEHPATRGGIGPIVEGSSMEKIVDDRWPTFEGTWKDEAQDENQDSIHFKLEYIASNGTIFQRFDFSSNDAIHESDDKISLQDLPRLQIDANLLLRDLDFVNSENEFNKHTYHDRSYESMHSQDCLIREHAKGRKKCILYIQAFNEHKPIPFSKIKKNSQVYTIRPENSSKETTSSDDKRRFTVIFAYTLNYGHEYVVDQKPLVEWEKVPATMDKLLRLSSNHTLTDHWDLALDFFMGRHLEYILSVCSIPVPDPADEDGPVPYALTCGDVESHRVTTPASFHAFQFLLLALDHYERADEANTSMRIKEMKKRIYKVCMGHVKWLFNTSGGFQCPNTWVSGKEIFGWATNRYLPKRFLANAPFQIIKACEFWELTKRYHLEFSLPTNKVKGAIDVWVKDLDDINQMGLYAFPRHDHEAIHSFYLVDHALIWRAVRAVEMVLPEYEFKGPTSSLPYSSRILQRNVIKRFTTENVQTEQLMVAVSRSPIQTRFLLRPGDNALFSAMDLGFFDALNSDQLSDKRNPKNAFWMKTLDCQKYYKDNENFLNWHDPRRFALSIAMTRAQKPMTSLSADEMCGHALSTLLNGSSANGLLPGWLGPNNAPAIYDSEESRDRYWEVTFEIPCLLWKYCHKRSQNTIPASKYEHAFSSKSGQKMVSDEETSILSVSTDDRNSSPEESAISVRTPRTFLNRVQPLHSSADEANIVELQDEWLYRKPSFFVKESHYLSPPAGSTTEKNQGSGPAGAVIMSANERQNTAFTGFMIDVPNSKLHYDGMLQKDKGLGELRDIRTVTDVTSLMGTERTIELAKKRFWFFSSNTPSGNESCLHTVFGPEDTGERLRNFVTRHTRFVSHFEEETSAVFNTWTTEFHLSFYRLSSMRSDTSNVNLDCCQSSPRLPAAPRRGYGKQLVKVAVGFQFEGDFFDRYWTCRFLEADQQEYAHRILDTQIVFGGAELTGSRVQLAGLHGQAFASLIQERTSQYWDEIKRPVHDGYGKSFIKESWKQRRVLELLLFGKMIQRINVATKIVLFEAGLSFRNKCQIQPEDNNKYEKCLEMLDEGLQDAFLIPTDGAVMSDRRVEEVQQALRTVIANLEGNIAQIDSWQNREKDRQGERPRWTFHRENRFRGIMQKLQVCNDQDILQLKRLHVRVIKLEESLVSKMEATLKRQEALSQIFTDATLYMLPLTFATSIYSMSEAPSRQTLLSMALTAFVTLIAIVVLGPVVKAMTSGYGFLWVSQQWAAFIMNAMEMGNGGRRKLKSIWENWTAKLRDVE